VTRLSDDRIRYAVRQAEMGGGRGETPKQMAARWGVSDRRVRQVITTWRKTGQIPTLNPKRRPKDPPLTEDQQRQVGDAWGRLQQGASKVWAELRKEGVEIPKHKIHDHMNKMGWSKPNPRKKKKRSRCRYEREHTGSLLHGDWHRTNLDSPHTILWLDDASRYILSGGEFDEETTKHSIRTLDQAIQVAQSWGLTISQVNTDRGTQFYNNQRYWADVGPSLFELHLQARGIQHVVSRRNNPQTNGKLERVWLEYDRHRDRFARLED
jgi:putative transposase